MNKKLKITNHIDQTPNPIITNSLIFQDTKLCMVKDKQTIVKELKDHISDRGGAYSEWYTGIAEDPKERLDQHNVNRKKGDKWAYFETASSDIAREIERHFVEALGTDGGQGGGTNATKSVYIYKKNDHTDP